MAQFLIIFSAVFSATMLAAVFTYAALLHSRGETRRGVSISIAAIVTLVATVLGVHAFNEATHGVLIYIAGFIAIVCAIWLIRDVAFPIDYEPQEHRQQPGQW